MELFGGLAGIGALAAGIGFAYAQFKSGGNKAKDDLITTLKETAVVEREKSERLSIEKQTLIVSHQNQINELSARIGKLQGLQEANEKKIEEYKMILQGRSPEQQKFMEFMTNVAKESGQYMRDSSKILKDIQTSLNRLDGRIGHSEEAIIKIAKSDKKITNL